MKHEWTETEAYSGESFLCVATDEDNPVSANPRALHLYTPEMPAGREILRLAARVRELEAPLGELLGKLRGRHEPGVDPVALEALALIGLRQTALEEENRRLRAQLAESAVAAGKEEIDRSHWSNVEEFEEAAIRRDERAEIRKMLLARADALDKNTVEEVDRAISELTKFAEGLR